MEQEKKKFYIQSTRAIMSNPIGITPYSRDQECKNSVVDCQGVSSKTESEGIGVLSSSP